ncbi:MAG TPA: thioredoxin family protein [Gammaproteobacteria bacterium]
MTELLIVTLIALPLGLLLAWQWSALLRARKSVGRAAPRTAIVDNGIDDDCRVYFFHAAHCSPCRAISPLVDSLRQEHRNLIKVDVAEHPELARGFGIRATPTFIAVSGSTIRAVKLGAPGEAWLQAHLTDCRAVSHE